MIFTIQGPARSREASQHLHGANRMLTIILRVMINDVRLVESIAYHIEAETRWPPHGIRHFQMHFLE